MEVLIGKGGYVESFAFVGSLVGGIEVEPPTDLDLFEVSFEAYQVKDGVLVFDENKHKALLYTQEAEDLRSIRETECFSYINRGSLWYDSLTETQKQEIKAWYDAWLNVTETRTVPDRPAWLK